MLEQSYRVEFDNFCGLFNHIEQKNILRIYFYLVQIPVTIFNCG